MDTPTNGHQPATPGPPTHEGRARLLTALDLDRAGHPVDGGALGEYVALLDSEGLAAARAAFPVVAAHLASGCDACNVEVRELRELATADDESQGESHAPRGPVGSASSLTGTDWTTAEPSATLGRVPDHPSAAERRRRGRRALTTGLLAVAAVAMIVMGATLYAVTSLAPGGGSGEIKLIARETLAAAPTSAPVTAPAAGPESATAAAAPAATVPAPTAIVPPTAAATPIGSPSAATSTTPLGAECPESHPVKANRPSGIYHVRGGEFYDRTRPETCFATTQDAERAGFRRSQR